MVAWGIIMTAGTLLAMLGLMVATLQMSEPESETVKQTGDGPDGHPQDMGTRSAGTGNSDDELKKAA